MKKNNDYWYVSSNGSGDLALTIKATLIGIVPILVMAGRYYGIELVETDLVDFIGQLFALVSLSGILVGLGRKIYYQLIRSGFTM